jgi:hypothetical protein
MATEILINDGGAPARILPFESAGTITAGMVLNIDANGKVVPADTDLGAGLDCYVAGVALNAASTGEMCNVISGSGIIVMALADDTGSAIGKGFTIGATAGQLSATTDVGKVSHVALTDNEGAAALAKFLVVA